MKTEGGVEDGIKGITVNEEILPQNSVGMKPVFDAPIFDLRWARQIHLSLSDWRICVIGGLVNWRIV